MSKNATLAEIQAFLNENFHHVGYEMRIVVPTDWRPEFALAKRLADPHLRQFAETIHAKWRGLARQFDRKRICTECQASSVQLPYPFIIPGGRFREFYYWDSFWILEGLYVSEMCTTAAGIVENMLIMVNEFGFIPNGARIYYLNRSQPPLFPQIVERYMQACLQSEKDKKEFLARALPSIEAEYAYWMKERSVEVEKSGRLWRLNVYRAAHWIPRPESFAEDMSVASRRGFDTELKQKLLYQNIASAAESGWDFSRRWFNNSDDFETIQTTSIVPVDLNVFMHANEAVIARLYDSQANTVKSAEYKQRAEHRKAAIDEFFWRPNGTGWSDFSLTTNATIDRPFYISDLAPLWHIDYGPERMQAVLSQHAEPLTKYAGGIPTSLMNTGQQWDYPNVWAPMQFFMIRLYYDAAAKEASYRVKALELSQRWLNTTYCGFQNFGQFFEKYDAEKVGFPGGGGEYIVQEGFGWTNALTLWILDRFGNELKVPESCAAVATGNKAIARLDENKAMPSGKKSESGDGWLRRVVLLFNLSVLFSCFYWVNTRQ
jgi:alpha,alpha-trehalase